MGLRKPRRNQPNHEPGITPSRHPTDCTKCEGAKTTDTPRIETDLDGVYSGGEVVKCSNCGGTGKEPR